MTLMSVGANICTLVLLPNNCVTEGCQRRSRCQRGFQGGHPRIVLSEQSWNARTQSQQNGGSSPFVSAPLDNLLRNLQKPALPGSCGGSDVQVASRMNCISVQASLLSHGRGAINPPCFPFLHLHRRHSFVNSCNDQFTFNPLWTRWRVPLFESQRKMSLTKVLALVACGVHSAKGSLPMAVVLPSFLPSTSPPYSNSQPWCWCLVISCVDICA